MKYLAQKGYYFFRKEPEAAKRSSECHYQPDIYIPYKKICTALDSESFETYFGFLHGIRYGRKSLALDIVEEFQQPVADRFVLQMFNKRIIHIYDFEFLDNGGVYLTEDGFRKFCLEYK